MPLIEFAIVGSALYTGVEIHKKRTKKKRLVTSLRTENKSAANNETIRLPPYSEIEGAIQKFKQDKIAPLLRLGSNHIWGDVRRPKLADCLSSTGKIDESTAKRE